MMPPLPYKSGGLLGTPLLGPAITLLCGLAGFALYLIAGAELAGALSVEGGPIEDFTFWAYLPGILLLLAVPAAYRLTGAHAAFLALMLMLREGDYHKALTSESVFRPKWYLEAADPLWVKLLAGLVVLGLIIALIAFVIKHARRFASGLRHGQALAWSIAAMIAAAGAAKSLDTGRRILKDWFGMTSEQLQWYRPLTLPIEEALELAIPLCILLAALQWRQGFTQRPGKGQ